MSLRTCRWLTLLLTACGSVGCRLPRNQGPVPQALLTSRQYSQQAVASMDRGQWSQAEAMLAKAVQTCPYDAEARRHYAEALWHDGRHLEAIGQLEEASRLTPDDAGLHARIADLRLQMGQKEAAHKRVEHALNLDPKLAVAWGVRAKVLQAMSQPREALADYHRALSYASDDRQLLTEMADLYVTLNEPQRALSTLQSLCDTYTPGEEPQEALVLLGRGYQRVGRHDDAAETLQGAMHRGPHTPELLCLLAQSQAAMGRTTDAQISLREALTLDPQHQASQELLGRLQVAQQAAPVQR